MSDKNDHVKAWTILVVDDKVEIIRLIANYLDEIPQFSVINANNGALACQIAKEQQPDLIIMDWDMPVMDGISATRQLKQDKSTFEIPVIIATGKMVTTEDLRLALESGAVDYIRKPIDLLELDARVKTALRIKEQNQAIQQLLQREIEFKSRQLSTTSMLIVEKNGILQEFHLEVEKVMKIILDAPKSAKSYLSQLNKRIKSHLDVDNSWDTFQLHFNQVHPNFFKKINEKHPDLSYKDLKLSAYLKMGLDNKQIAQLLGIAASSTRTSLTRLKRKLGIPEEESLRKRIAEFD